MKVYGIEITEHQINQAVSFMRSGPFTLGRLEIALIDIGVPHYLEGRFPHQKEYVANRAADRIIQKHRGACPFTLASQRRNGFGKHDHHSSSLDNRSNSHKGSKGSRD